MNDSDPAAGAVAPTPSLVQGSEMSAGARPSTLHDLRNSGWNSRSVKEEIRSNFLRMLHKGEELFPGIIGYDDTVIPEINLALLAGHDLLFLGEKGQAKSRLMRSIARFLDEAVRYLDDPSLPVHEDRDVQIRGYPIQFDVDVLIVFSANPATFNRSGKVIPQLKDRIGSLVQTHYPRERGTGIEIMEQEANIDLGGEFPVVVPYFMKEVIEQISVSARKSKYVDHQSGVSARFSIANYRTMVASARQRGVRLGERPAVPRVSDLGHLYSSSLGKLELDMMGSHQMSERQVLEAIIAEAVKTVFEEYVDKTGLEEIAQVFGKGVKIEVGDLLPSAHYADRLKRVPRAWEKAFEVNASESEPVRASCVEFILAGLYATDRISRSQKHGRITYEIK